MDVATWIIAISTGIYTIAFIVTVFYIAKQLKENKLLRESTVLKEAYDYIIRTHKYRKIIYDNERDIRAVRNTKSLDALSPEVKEAIHEVTNCYHYIGFLMKYGLLTNKQGFFEEGGDTFLRIYEIIKPVIKQERIKMSRETYKQYLEYLAEEMSKYKRKEKD